VAAKPHIITKLCRDIQIPVLTQERQPLGERITGVVDWDEFGLGSRALDLVVPALDCEKLGAPAAADRLLAAAASAVGDAGLRCLVSYRALASLAEDTREGLEPQADIRAISTVLDRLS
jgi:hypothetical protein